jgi:hypothetical protein
MGYELTLSEDGWNRIKSSQTSASLSKGQNKGSGIYGALGNQD